MKLLPVFLVIAILQACTTVGSTDRPNDYYASQSSSVDNGILSSTTLGGDDDNIRALLSYRVELPRTNRIAILKLNNDNRWRNYSGDFTALNESIATQLVDKLRSSERVYDASFLPAMLVPADKSILAVRSAAARFQADLLLGYRSLCGSYQKYKLLSPNETKSYCSVEAVLLDVRSGVIVKSVVSAQEFMTEKKKEDTNFHETVWKAELEAVAKALGEVAEETVSFMKGVPVL